VPLGAGTAAKRFTATAVFAVDDLNATVFVELIAHAPVKIAMRKVFGDDTGIGANSSGLSARSPVSTLRIVLTIRSAAASSKMTGRVIGHSGGAAKKELKFTSR
jgi:hypothetical protein